MLPELFRIGDYPVRSFGVLLLVGFALGTWLATRRAEKYGIDKDSLMTLAVWAVIMGVVGSRVFWVLQEWDFYSKNPGQIVRLTEGGMTSYGGIVFALGTIAIWCKRTGTKFSTVFDLLAAPALVMHAMGRVGCFLNGCCYGAPCSLPWAVTVHPEVGTVYLGHPAQLYDTLMSLTGAAILLFMEKRGVLRDKPGGLGAMFLILYGVARFIYEIFRAGFSSASTWGVPLTDAQVMAAAMITIGLIWLIVLSRRTTGRKASVS